MIFLTNIVEVFIQILLYEEGRLIYACLYPGWTSEPRLLNDGGAEQV